MIVLTRLNGSRFAINDEQIERLEEGHETVVVLVTGNRYTVQESLDEIVEAIVGFRAKVLSTTEHLDSESDVRKRHHSALSVFHSPTGRSHVPDSGDINTGDIKTGATITELSHTELSHDPEANVADPKNNTILGRFSKQRGGPDKTSSEKKD